MFDGSNPLLKRRATLWRPFRTSGDTMAQVAHWSANSEKKSQHHRPFENREGAATRKNRNRAEGCATRPINFHN
jgi:hypothetical protein